MMMMVYIARDLVTEQLINLRVIGSLIPISSSVGRINHSSICNPSFRCIDFGAARIHLPTSPLPNVHGGAGVK